MSYTRFDRFVSWRRYRAVLPHVRPGSRVCDVGCGLEAGFLIYAARKILWGVGLDRQLSPSDSTAWPLICADITKGLPVRSESFDHVVMLAVIEHQPDPVPLLRETFRILLPGGSLIMTWPQGAVDPLLHILNGIGFISHEMESQEHQKRIPLGRLKTMLEEIGYRGAHHERFELGLNNLMVAFRPC